MFPVEKIARIVKGELLRGGTDIPKRGIHDSRLVFADDLFIALQGQRSDGQRFLADAFDRGACAAIVSGTRSLPDNARNLIVVNDPRLALQRLASAWRDTSTATFIAITGSNGKTTVRNLLGHLLTAYAPTYVSPQNYNTEIGVPIALLSMPADTQFGVFELGAEEPGDIAVLARILKPQFGIITSVGPGHLDGFETVEDVAIEKWSLVGALPEDGIAFLNGDSSHLLQRASTAPVAVITAGLHAGDLRARIVQAVPNLEIKLDAHDISLSCSLIGTHNANNLLLAAAAAHAVGMSWESISTQAASFDSIPHRLNAIQTAFGTILDDTYNANPDSMAAALEVLATFGDRDAARVFVFGEMRGLGEDTDRFHLEIARLALSLPIDIIIPTGEAAVAACRSVDTSKIMFLPREEIGQHLFARELAPQTTVLIKGSRALGLETLVEELRVGG